MIKDILIKHMCNNNIAVIDNEIQYTFKQIYDSVMGHVAQIGDIGSENIGLYINNSVDYIIGYFAISFLDKVIIPIETNIKGYQVISTIDYCDINIIITNNTNYPKLVEILDEAEQSNIMIYNIDDRRKEDFRTKKETYKSVKSTCSNKDVAIMLHTSGTTDNPKKVMLTHENLINNIQSNIKSLKLTEKDRSLIVLPMCFGYCNTSQFLTHFYLGASLVIYNGIFLPGRFFLYINKYNCTNTTCIPAMLYLINSSTITECNVQSLRYLCFGGGTIDIDVIRGICNRLPEVGIVQTYGLTEAGPRVTCLLPDDTYRKIGSVGKAIPGVSVKIFDENDNELPANKKGEIVVKGKNVMKGYYKRPAETKEVIRNGWLHTGDVGMFDVEGYLYVLGRIKNVIITGGLNIYPEEIEAVIQKFQSIENVVVSAKKHKVLGEIPVAQVTIKKDREFNVDDLLKYCKEKLDIQKIPREIVVVDKIEKTYNGKIKRNDLYASRRD